MSIQFNNSYVNLPPRFFSVQAPTPVTDPKLIRVNHELASLLGIDPEWLKSDAAVATLAGNLVPEGAEPIATAYAGHQFGSFNPHLGDGRAVLLGEVIGTDGNRYDVQLKGAGPTPYSRMGDGRSPLGPVLREYIVSEAMAALGVPTSRALAAVLTTDPVYREEPLPGAVLTRVASSHIRVGTMQFLASRNDTDGLTRLIAHVIDRHFPDLAGSESPALALFARVIEKQASLIARWQMLGFIHGVMNTDNMLLCGETVDYGPCAFMDTYNPAQVYSSIDQGGRYAFRNQPGIANWNLMCLAQTIVPVVHTDEEKAVELIKPVLETFPTIFLDKNLAGLRRKLGLLEVHNDDEALAQDFLDLMENEAADFTLAFRRLAEIAGDAQTNSVSTLFDFSEAWRDWLNRWQARCAMETHPDRQAAMLAANPALIPRNHLVERAITEATRDGNLSFFHQMVEVLSDPYNLAEDEMLFATPPTPGEIVQQTFCGT